MNCDGGYSGKSELKDWNDCHINDITFSAVTLVALIPDIVLIFYASKTFWRIISASWVIRYWVVLHKRIILFHSCTLIISFIRVTLAIFSVYGYRLYMLDTTPTIFWAISNAFYWASAIGWFPSLWRHVLNFYINSRRLITFRRDNKSFFIATNSIIHRCSFVMIFFFNLLICIAPLRDIFSLSTAIEVFMIGNPILTFIILLYNLFSEMWFLRVSMNSLQISEKHVDTFEKRLLKIGGIGAMFVIFLLLMSWAIESPLLEKHNYILLPFTYFVLSVLRIVMYVYILENIWPNSNQKKYYDYLAFIGVRSKSPTLAGDRKGMNDIDISVATANSSNSPYIVSYYNPYEDMTRSEASSFAPSRRRQDTLPSQFMTSMISQSTSNERDNERHSIYSPLILDNEQIQSRSKIEISNIELDT